MFRETSYAETRIQMSLHRPVSFIVDNKSSSQRILHFTHSPREWGKCHLSQFSSSASPLRDQETDICTRKTQVAEAHQSFNNLATAQNVLLTILFVWLLEIDKFWDYWFHVCCQLLVTVRRTDQFLTHLRPLLP